MTNLRKEARGRPCLIRTSQCRDERDTTVGCHIRFPGITGVGLKAPDLFIAWGCHICHGICDGRIPSEYTAEERRVMLLDGMVRTQYQLIREGKLLCE